MQCDAFFCCTNGNEEQITKKEGAQKKSYTAFVCFMNVNVHFIVVIISIL